MRIISNNVMKFHFSQIQNRKLVLIRHGQSIVNKNKIWAGWMDVRLSSNGIKQTKECGKLLKQNKFTFNQAYSSILARSVQTLNIILDELDLHYIPVHKTWRLNQKHYGALQGQSKFQINQKYGDEKVDQWRRSFTVSPPPIDKKDERHPIHDRKYSNIDLSHFKGSQNQTDVINRVRPLWQQQLKPKILSGKDILITAHGGSIRALAKLISNLPDDDIKRLNIPSAVPLIYTIGVQNQQIKSAKISYLGNLQEITRKMQKVRNEARSSQ